MNKKFYTLMAGIILAGSAFNSAYATNVTAKEFNDAIKNGVLQVNSEEENALVIKDGKIELTGDVTLAAVGEDFDSKGKYVIINEEGITLTTSEDYEGKQAKITGMVFVQAEGVTIDNLNLDYTISEHVAGKFSTVLKVYADDFTLKNSKLSGALTTEGETQYNVINGVILYPQTKDADYTITGNTFSGFTGVTKGENASIGAPGDVWYSSALQVYKNAKYTPVGGEKATSADCAVDAAALKGSNTFEGNDADIFVRNNDELNGGVVEAAYVTYSEDAADGLKAVVKEAAKKMESGERLNFDGSAEELAELTKKLDVNVPVITEDGLITTGVTLCEESIDIKDGSEYLLATGLSDKASYETSDYYLLVQWNSDGAKVVTIGEDGAIALKKLSELTLDEATVKENLWKMKQTLDDDGDYTFTFTNKAGDKLKDYFQSVGKTPYANGVVFAVSGDDLTGTDETYYGLYKSAVHKLTESQMNWYQGKGFFMDFELAEDETLARTEAFTGMLRATDGTIGNDATVFALMNEDLKYVVAKKLQTNGNKVDNYTYEFTTISKKTYDDDKVKAADKREYFGEFSFYYTPTSAADDLQAIEKIDKVTVKVINEDGALEEAIVGKYNLEGVNTLAASIAYGLTEVKINMADNVVDPAKFLKNGYVTIKDVKTGKYFAANDCDGFGMVETYGNPLEIQWAVKYDRDNKTYTLTNREDNTILTNAISYKLLREDGVADNGIYVFGGRKYEITFSEGADASSNYYKYLGDVKNQTFKMAHWSGVYNNNAWFTADEDDFAMINIDADKALEFKAANGETAADTAKVKTTVSFFAYDAKAKKDIWQDKEYTLEVPVYTFSVNGKMFGLNGKSKYNFGRTGEKLAIRNDGDHYNLRSVTVEDVATMDCNKIYASTSDAEAGYLKKMYGLYTETTNDLFDVVLNDRPEYRRLGATVEDGFTSNVDTAKFFRTNGVKNLYLYENTMNRNTDKERSLNFLGEVQSDYLPANVQLPFVVDTAFVRNNTQKPLYLLAVRTTFEPAAEDKPCDVPGHGMNCEHAVKGHEGYRTGDYLVTLDDSLNIKGLDVQFNKKTRLAFVPAKHIGDTLQIMSSKWTGSKIESLAKKDSIFFSETDDKGNVSQKGENAAAFAFKLVDPKKAVEEGMADFYIENTAKNGQVRYVHVLNSVPVLVDDLHEASTFNVEAAAEGETPTANEGIATEGVSVVATNGAVIVKGAEGKNVVITNVLGQTIANTVVSSDEATIATPAGVVVVAVEGEAAVKAIVK